MKEGTAAINIIVANKMKALSKEDALHEMGEALLKEGFVRDSFLEAVLKREVIFPTGLPAKPSGVAIPHTDIEHVLSPAIVISVLKEELEFTMMGTKDTVVLVKVIFMLALDKHDDQLKTLEAMMDIIQNEELMSEMISGGNRGDTQLIENLMLAEMY